MSIVSATEIDADVKIRTVRHRIHDMERDRLNLGLSDRKQLILDQLHDDLTELLSGAE